MLPETESLFRPYAPPANMQALLHRLRRMNMPPRITRELLKGVGISENIVPRVSSTLRFLGLTNENDEPTEIFRGLAGSTEDEYRQLLEKTVHRAYAEEFQSVDPRVDPQERIMNAFQRYIPRSQHGRQVTLFLGLCREAGIATLDVPRKRGMQSQIQGRHTAARPQSGRVHQSTEISREDGGVSRPAGRRDPQHTPAQLLGITLEDAAHLPEDDFWEVWNALGTLFLRRAQRLHLGSRRGVSATAEQTGENETMYGDIAQ
ncbi:MAG: DUF5343 domain-containing protein [Chloroflexi bacterium]|nr:DUF5343 domain-containing protein [Chloroflexota bacterium]